MRESIASIKKTLSLIEEENDPRFQKYIDDERKGVHDLLAKWRKNKRLQQELEIQHENMTAIENEKISRGYVRIGGIDEAGRGPLAGPVVAACVVLSPDFRLLGLTDSKKLSKAKREKYFSYIREHAEAVGTGIVSASEIDKFNIYEASKLAMMRAVRNISDAAPDYLLIDAMKLDLNIPQDSLIKGDSRSLSIAAASVIAKVTRDAYMDEIDNKYPDYGFASHAGYGTKGHLEAIKTHGVLEEHRRSFSPVAQFIQDDY